jgi:mercuric ion binding protein
VKHFPKAVLTAFALALSGGALLPLTTPTSAQSTTIQVAVGEQTQTFAIENMTCALCPVTVRMAMEKVTGVKSVAVDFEAKTATVVYDPSVATAEAIAAASTNVGYPAKATGS